MPASPLQIIEPQQIAGSATIYYTSTSIKTRIDALSVCNTSAGAVTVSVYIVPDGGAVGDDTTVVKTLSLPSLYTWPGIGLVGLMLAPGDTIRAVASVVGSLTIVAAGTQI